MKPKQILLILLLACTSLSFAQNAENAMNYRRSSIYSIVVVHKGQKFSQDIFKQFSHIPVPDRYNDHNLSVVGLYTDGTTTASKAEIDNFIIRNKIASRMVSKWFNRDMNTGVCDVKLVKARGLYNATELDKALASRSVRGNSLLEDAGESLIGNTYLIVNDVTYVDVNQGAQVAAGVMVFLGALAGAALDVASSSRNNNRKGIDTGGWGTTLGTLAGAGVGAMISTIKGFRVKITTSLYRLKWDEETANTFYSQHYTEVPDRQKCVLFDMDRDKFKLEYVGQVVSRGSNVSFLGINEDHPEMMIRKACQRAIDENVVDLQRKFEMFKVKSPIQRVGTSIQVPIGMKEGVNPKSVYEVLQARESGNKIVYDRIATIQPDKEKIWDNRFMAVEEKARNATLGYTSFHKLSGGTIMQGMLVREIKSN